MARRRRLETPSVDDLRSIEAELDGAQRPATMAPIAQVAAEAARLTETQPPEIRASQAADHAEAAMFREARDKGLVIEEIDLSDIAQDTLSRDRARLDEEELEELVASIRVNGLRLPIELSRLTDDEDGRRFGLISGYRRLTAFHRLRSETGDRRWDKIPALVRQAAALEAAYVAMVEENEIRAELSAYERGRVAVLAVGEGAFPSVEAAVDRLFATASKAKRSKIRSFAMVHETLGDVLRFSTSLTERQGLRLANAIRAGFEEDLRQALSFDIAANAETEWSLLEPVLDSADAERTTRRQSGRPRQDTKIRRSGGRAGEIALQNGMSISLESSNDGYAIRFHGRNADAELIRTVMLEIQRLLG